MMSDVYKSAYNHLRNRSPILNPDRYKNRGFNTIIFECHSESGLRAFLREWRIKVENAEAEVV